MIRDIILKEKISERNRKQYLDAHPDWFKDIMNLKSKHDKTTSQDVSF